MPSRLLALSLLTTVLVTGCSAGTETAVDDDPVVRAPSAVTPSTATPTVAPTVVPSVAGPRVVEVAYAGGQVTGVGSRVAAELGEQLVLRITSDVADEVHLHGYDLRADVAAGGTVEIPFTASIPGGFEVELEGLGRALFQLRVA